MTVKWYGDEFMSKIEDATAAGLEACAAVVEADAVLNCPVHDSLLRNSIYREVDRDEKRARVGASAEYAAAVEYGRRPGKMPPVDALRKWAKDILGDAGLAFPIAKKIASAGTKSQPYLRPALDNNARKFSGIMARELRRVTG